jgi:hypothetical protein
MHFRNVAANEHCYSSRLISEMFADVRNRLYLLFRSTKYAFEFSMLLLAPRGEASI